MTLTSSQSGHESDFIPVTFDVSSENCIWLKNKSFKSQPRDQLLDPSNDEITLSLSITIEACTLSVVASTLFVVFCTLSVYSCNSLKQ